MSVSFFKCIYTVEIDTKEKLWNLFFDTSSVFNPERLTRKKTNSLRRFEMEMVYIFSQCGITRDTPHNLFKQHYHLSTFLSFAMQNPHWLYIFSLILKPDKLKGVLLIWLNKHHLKLMGQSIELNAHHTIDSIPICFYFKTDLGMEITMLHFT